MEEDNDKYCRVCHCGEEEGRTLYYPCCCKGSIKYVHQDCLMEWIKVSNQEKPTCELCGVAFSFQRVYAPGAPKSIGFLYIALEVWKRFIACVYVIIKLFSLFCIFFCILPYTTFLFLELFLVENVQFDSWTRSTEGSYHGLPQKMLIGWFVGIFLSLGILLTTIVVVGALIWLNRFIDKYLQSIETLGQAPAAPLPAHLHPQVNPQQQQPVAPPDVDVNLNDLLRAAENPPIRILDLELNFNSIDMSLEEFFSFTCFAVLLLVWNVTCIFTFTIVTKSIGAQLATVLTNFCQTYSHQHESASGYVNGVVIEDVICLISQGASSYHHFVGVAALIITFNILVFSYFYIKVGRLSIFYSFLLVTFDKIKKLISDSLVPSLLFSLEILVIPNCLGWLTDCATLDSFGLTLRQRVNLTSKRPIASAMVHTLVGYVVIILVVVLSKSLRKYLDKTVAKVFFPKNLTIFDEFSMELMQPKSLWLTCNRLILSTCYYLVGVWLFAYVGSSTLFGLLPQLSLQLHADAPAHFPFEIVMYQFVMPQLFARVRLQSLVLGAVQAILYQTASICGCEELIRPSSLTLDESINVNVNTREENYQFTTVVIRLFKYFSFIFLLFIFSVILIVCIWRVPLIIGKHLSSFFGVPVVSDLYVFSIGIAVCLITLLAVTYLCQNISDANVTHILNCGNWLLYGLKVATLGLVWVIVIPSIIGYLIEFSIVCPLLLRLDEIPIYPWSQCWVIGVVTLNFWIRCTMIGAFGQSSWRAHFNRVAAAGFRNIDFTFIMVNLTIPVLRILLDALLIPYFLSTTASFFTSSLILKQALRRYAHCCYFSIKILYIAVIHLRDLYIEFHDNIRDTSFLIGKQLENREVEDKSEHEIKESHVNQPLDFPPLVDTDIVIEAE